MVQRSTESEPDGPPPAVVGFDRFTDEAKHTMNQARAEAQRLDHDTLSTGHVLLGLLDARSRPAAAILANALVRADDVRVALAKVTREARTGRTTSSLPFSAKAKALLEHSLRRAQELGATEFGTEHLLLGLLDDRDSDACRGLTGVGIECDRVRDAVLRWVERERGEG